MTVEAEHLLPVKPRQGMKFREFLELPSVALSWGRGDISEHSEPMPYYHYYYYCCFCVYDDYEYYW